MTGVRETRSESADKVQAWYTNCPVFIAGNVDSELGWVRDEFEKLRAKFSYFRSDPGHDSWPHYLHNLDNFFRFGGNVPAIKVRSDLRDTKLIGLQWVNEPGALVVRSRDDIHGVSDLKGKRIGISQSMNPMKIDWMRVAEERGIELILKLHGLTRADVEIVDMPYEENWYAVSGKPFPLLEKPSDAWRRMKLKTSLAFRPLERSLEEGEIDACYSTDGLHLAQERSGKFKVIETLARYPDWTLKVQNSPYTITVDSEFAEKHPELIIAYMRGIIKVATWCNANRAAAASILYKHTFVPTEEDALEAVSDIDFVPNLEPRNIAAIEIQKEFMLEHGYIEHDFDVADWIAPEFAQAAMEGL